MTPGYLSPKGNPQYLVNPAVPELVSSRLKVVNGGRSITPVSSYVPRSSRTKNLSTIMEKPPQTYQPTIPTRSLPSDVLNSDSDDSDTTLEPPERNKPHTTITTTSSTDSITSYHGGVIYIKPSPQLQSMQAMKEHVREDGDTTPYGPWTRSNMYMTHSSASLHMTVTSYVPSGTPLATFNTLGNTNIDASEDTSPTPQAPQFEYAKQESDQSSKTSDWVEPSPILEEPTQWIEGFLTRKAEADQLVSKARFQTRKHQNGICTVEIAFKQVNKLMRRLSNSASRRKHAAENSTTTGFDPRQERVNRSQAPPSARRQQQQQDHDQELQLLQTDNAAPPRDSGIHQRYAICPHLLLLPLPRPPSTQTHCTFQHPLLDAVFTPSAARVSAASCIGECNFVPLSRTATVRTRVWKWRWVWGEGVCL